VIKDNLKLASITPIKFYNYVNGKKSISATFEKCIFEALYRALKNYIFTDRIIIRK